VELEEIFGAEILNGRAEGHPVDRVADFEAEVLVREARIPGRGRWSMVGAQVSGPAEGTEVLTVEKRRRRKGRAEVSIDRIGKSGHRRDHVVVEAGRIVPDRVEGPVVQTGRRSVPKKKDLILRFPMKLINRKKSR
jgi:hypothetical protein